MMNESSLTLDFRVHAKNRTQEVSIDLSRRIARHYRLSIATEKLRVLVNKSLPLGSEE